MQHQFPCGIISSFSLKLFKAFAFQSVFFVGVYFKLNLKAGLSNADILRTGRSGFVQSKKLRIFQNIWRVHTDRGGGGVQFYAILY